MSDPNDLKTCIICRQDCSSRPRVKDKLGRYVCKSCDDARASAHPRAALHPAPAPSSDPSLGLVPFPDTYDLAPDLAPLSLPLEPTPDAPPAPPREPKPAAHPVAKPAPLKCRKCGYDLVGLRVFRCPECGTPFGNKPSRRAGAPSDPAGRSLLKPFILTVISLVLAALWLHQIDLIRGSGADDALIRSMVGFAFKIPIAIAIYLMCCVVWMGFDMRIREAIPRLIALSAISTLVGIPVGYIPFIFTQAGIMIFVYFCLYANLLEADVYDAIFMACITVVANLVLVLGILTALL